MQHRKLKNNELQRKSIEEFKTATKTPIRIILDNIRSTNNIGSVFRTADAFLLEKIHLCGVCATPPDRGIRKTAIGATETVAWDYHKDSVALTKELKTQGYKIIAVEQAENAIMLNDFIPDTDQKYALVMGNEVKGVQQEIVDLSDCVIEIPQLGTKHSLNISVSTGIVVWDIFSKR